MLACLKGRDTHFFLGCQAASATTERQHNIGKDPDEAPWGRAGLDSICAMLGVQCPWLHSPGQVHHGQGDRSRKPPMSLAVLDGHTGHPHVLLSLPSPLATPGWQKSCSQVVYV